MKDLRNKELINKIHKAANKKLKVGDSKGVIETYKDAIIYESASEQDSIYYENLAVAYEQFGDTLYSRVMNLQGKMLDGQGELIKQLLEPIQKQIMTYREQLKHSPMTYQLYYLLAYQHALKVQPVEACIYYRVYEKYSPHRVGKDELVGFINRHECVKRFYDQLKNEQHTYCFLAQDDPEGDERLAHALALLGQKVYVVMKGKECQLGEGVLPDWPEIINQQVNAEAKVSKILVEYEVGRWDEVVESFLIDFNERYCAEASVVVIGEKKQMKKIQENIALYKIMQKVYVESVPRTIPCLAAYMMGNYLYTAQYLYEFDVVNQMKQEPETKISIVIPVNECNYTLEKTLETCLNQRFEEYEIVVSDNSSPEYTKIYDLVKQINNPKIKYYRTPYELPLVKNFEYAYLKSKGEFIFAIGPDDAVLPYALQYMWDAVEQNPESNLLIWQKLVYVWPEVEDAGEASKFCFPVDLEKDKQQLYTISGEQAIEVLIEGINQGINHIDTTPMIYINSGMRRRHILKLIEKTGKILDGSTPDMYIGIVNLALEECVLCEKTPLIIDGRSKGNRDSANKWSNDTFNKFKEYIGEYNRTSEWMEYAGTVSQRYITPRSEYDLGIHELMKVCDLRLHTKAEEWQRQVDFEKLYTWDVQDMMEQPLGGIDFLERTIEGAYEYSQEIGEWVEEYIRNASPRTVIAIEAEKKEEEKEIIVEITEKKYLKGNDGSLLTIDAESFGIRDIREASEFFIKLFNL